MHKSRYRTVMDDAERRLAGGSEIIKTKLGNVECSQFGMGSPVLISHGNGGGYDQAELIAKTFIGSNFMSICISRFGYLRTPHSVGIEASAAAQADHYASLLDSLGIAKASIAAFSDGGPSALQFAIRHPERCTGLIMMSAKSHTPPKDTLMQKIVFNTIFRSNYLFWYLTSRFKPFLLMMFGISKEIQEKLTTSDMTYLDKAVETMHPMYLRRNGIYNDRTQLSILPPDDYPLQKITAPTLVIHTLDDGLQPFSHALNSVDRIPGASLMKFEEGGHLLSGHIEEVKSEINDFLNRHNKPEAVASI